MFFGTYVGSVPVVLFNVGARKWVVRIIVGSLILVCLWFFSLFVLDGPIDFYLYRAEVERIPLPPKTVLIDQQSGFGLQVANGNHCDYVVRLLFRTSLHQKELQSFYQGRKVHAVPGSFEGVPIEATVFRIGDYRYGYDLPPHWLTLGKKPNVYAVEYFDSTEAGLDFRCN